MSVDKNVGGLKDVFHIIDGQVENEWTKMAALRNTRGSQEGDGGCISKDDLITSIFKIGVDPLKKNWGEAEIFEFEQNKVMRDLVQGFTKIGSDSINLSILFQGTDCGRDKLSQKGGR